jgi:hypothetical protein
MAWGAADAIPYRQKEESSFSEEKEAKRLLISRSVPGLVRWRAA